MNGVKIRWVETLKWVEKELEDIYAEEKKYSFGMYDDNAPDGLIDRYLSACNALEELVEKAKKRGRVSYLKKILTAYPCCAYEVALEFKEFEDLFFFSKS